MARADILSTLYSKKTTALDFNFDSLIAPPLYTLIPNRDLERMHKLVTSVKYTSKIDYKEAEIKKIMSYYGFTRFASGTHRVVYRHLDYPYLIAKISLNKSSLMDNVREFQNQAFLKPFCCKCFEVDQTGMIGLFEKVDPILSREEFASIAGDIFDFINEKIIGKYIVDDIGTESFMNYGLRRGFGPVLLDYPEVYPLDGNKLYCNKYDQNTGLFCGGVLDYDPGFNTVFCQKCGRTYEARELQLLEKNNEVIKKGVSTNMKLEIRRGDTIIKTVDSNTTPTDYIEPPKKKRTASRDQMSMISNPRPRGRMKKSSNNPQTRNNATHENHSISTGLGLNTMAHAKKEENPFVPKSAPCHIPCNSSENTSAESEKTPDANEYAEHDYNKFDEEQKTVETPHEVAEIQTNDEEDEHESTFWREYGSNDNDSSNETEAKGNFIKTGTDENPMQHVSYKNWEPKPKVPPLPSSPHEVKTYPTEEAAEEASKERIPEDDEESSYAYKDKASDDFNSEFGEELRRLSNIKPDDEPEEDPENELGGEKEDEPLDELGGNPETYSYNTDTGFIPSAAEISGEVKSNPFTAAK